MRGSGYHEDHVADNHSGDAETEARGHNEEHNLRHDELWKHGQHKDQKKHCHYSLQGAGECCPKLLTFVQKHWINILPLRSCPTSATLLLMLLMLLLMMLLVLLLLLMMMIVIH